MRRAVYSDQDPGLSTGKLQNFAAKIFGDDRAICNCFHIILHNVEEQMLFSEEKYITWKPFVRFTLQ